MRFGRDTHKPPVPIGTGGFFDNSFTLRFATLLQQLVGDDAEQDDRTDDRVVQRGRSKDMMAMQFGVFLGTPTQTKAARLDLTT